MGGGALKRESQINYLSKIGAIGIAAILASS